MRNSNVKKIYFSLLAISTSLLSLPALADEQNACVAAIESHANYDYLEMNDCNIEDKDVPAIVNFLKNHPNTSHVNLDNNFLTSVGAQLLSEVKTLKSIYLIANHVGDKGAEALAHSSIEAIDLGDNQVNDQGAEALAQNKGLIYVYLPDNRITDKGAIAIATNKNITGLDLAYNLIGDKGAVAIASMPNLDQVFLMNNSIGDEGAFAFAKYVPLSVNGLDLRLDDNNISKLGIDALMSNPNKNFGVSFEGNPGATELGNTVAKLKVTHPLNGMKSQYHHGK